MPRFDFLCPVCQEVRMDVYISTADVTAPRVVCPHCGAPMVRKPAAPAFVVNGYNAKNGYSK